MWVASGKLSTFCLTDRDFNQSFLCRFLLFPFTKLPNLRRNKYVNARTERKRPPLVRGHHWSPASSVRYETSLVLPTGTCSNISFIHHFSYYVWLYYQGCQRWKNKVLISTDSMLIWTDNTLSFLVFLCRPSRKIIVLHDRSKSTTRKSCK